MGLQPFLLERLVCPETYQSLTLADEQTLATFNQLVEARSIRDAGGKIVSRPLQQVLLRQDRKVAYPVWDSVPYMRPDHAIPTESVMH